ncbi:group XIIA secretory phospholipase A2-like protein [Leptotrombidium deliense]|uniref:Group XIIA secretory phospholipase A2-like protein n=1 Tax=Leptotrombidium deliense TaxID=299467 RepID=A0A443RVY8_9ACAR|nr:group XIIA secretory phospholipase A2-like protein [Leptotrombidium deliense]
MNTPFILLSFSLFALCSSNSWKYDYFCANGTKVSKPNKIPTFNGCGSDKFDIPRIYTFKEATECCNTHDICYASCNSTREQCDDELKMCLQPYRKGFLNKLYIGFMLAMVKSPLACIAYNDAQKEYCDCKLPEK